MINNKIKMGFITDVNDWFAEHPIVFRTILGSLVVAPVVFFTCSLVHVLKGNRHPFPIWMNSAGILATTFYWVHSYFLKSNTCIENVFFYLAYITITI